MTVSLHYQVPGAIGISTTEGIKTHQCSMCLYLVCGNNNTCEERRSISSLLYTTTGSSYLFQKIYTSSNVFCQITWRWHPLITQDALKRNRRKRPETSWGG